MKNLYIYAKVDEVYIRKSPSSCKLTFYKLMGFCLLCIKHCISMNSKMCKKTCTITSWWVCILVKNTAFSKQTSYLDCCLLAELQKKYVLTQSHNLCFTAGSNGWKKIPLFWFDDSSWCFQIKKPQGPSVFANHSQSVLCPVYQARLSQALITLNNLKIML